jgi:arsenite methyltransferase
VGGSHRLPFSDSSINLGIMECTFSSFQDKHLVLREIERILKSRGKLAISDIHVNGEVPAELRQAPFQELCVAGALSLDQYCNLLRESGFEIVVAQNRHDEALEYVYLIKKKLFLAQLLVGVGKVVIEKRTIDYAVGLATLSRKAIDEGVLGYGVVVAQKKR